MKKQVSRRQAIYALTVAGGYVFARGEVVRGQAPVSRSLRFPLDSIDALVFSYGGDTISLTPKEIMSVLKQKGEE